MLSLTCITMGMRGPPSALPKSAILTVADESADRSRASMELSIMSRAFMTTSKQPRVILEYVAAPSAPYGT